jgi:hypothetical protein
MAIPGLDPGIIPAIYVFPGSKLTRRTWMSATIPGSSPGTGMTLERD